MGYTDELLNDIRAQLAPDDAVLKEARERRDTARKVALSFRGARRSFASGSTAHGTANCPIHHRDEGLDADSGVVLDRRVYPHLGPDSVNGVGPNDIVADVSDHIGPLLRVTYPKAELSITKRAIYITFGEPLPGGEDPTVDLVVGLERRDAPGLWIPNTERQRWDASDPEMHTALFAANPKQLRVIRARATRLAKAENKRSGVPPLCSFNLEALAWMFVEAGMGQAAALLALWERGAVDLSRRLTPDPVGVSGPIKVADRDRAVRRLRHAAECLAQALARDDDQDWVREQLKELWPDFVSSSPSTISKARAVAQVRSGNAFKVTSTGLLATASGTTLKIPSAFGDRSGR